MESSEDEGRSSFSWLVWLSMSMFAGSMAAAYIPLAVKLSTSKMRMMTLFGCGLLVGVALIVIIPEGVEVIMKSGSESRDQGSMSRPLGAPPNIEDEDEDPDHAHEESEAKTLWIGGTLAAGFILQLVVDQIGSGHMGHSHNASPQKKDSSDYRSVLSSSSFEDEEDNDILIASTTRKADMEIGAVRLADDSHARQNSSFGAFIGLLVHAAADGVALGASSLAESSSLGVVVFLAVMLHKMPAAFGLTSFFMAAGLRRRQILLYAFLFSLSAPLTSIFTYAIVSTGVLKGDSEQSIGALLLFSGGTFLYVATCHVLPEVTAHEKPLKGQSLMLLICGILAPLLVHFGHEH